MVWVGLLLGINIMFYSPSTKGFYSPDINTDIPEDVVEISYEQWQSLLNSQSAGKLITTGEDGGPVAVNPPPPTKEETQARMVILVQARLEDAAKAMGYDSILSACSYADEPAVTKFQNEGKLLRAWRSLTWEKCNQIVAQVNAGTLQIPSESELFNMLPAVPGAVP